MDAELKKLKEVIDESSNIVFFGGAGVSTESGVKDFRSADGLYSQTYDYPPETMLSHSFFETHPEEFFRFYRDKLLCTWAKPNPAHVKLAEWERMGKLRAIITQNVDGLHQAAGSRTVLELHGSMHRNYCLRCGKIYDAQFMESSTGIPRCTCKGMVRPDVVLYEEGLDSSVLTEAISHLRAADTLIIGGTSLVVYPAASLIHYYRGNRLILINKTPGPCDDTAYLAIHRPIGEVLSQC
jgi:NAD-dependent deacetylase